MSICPKCKKVITYLYNYQSNLLKSYFELDENKKKRYVEDTNLWDDKVNDFECPECNDVLFTDEDEAEKFLLQKDEIGELIIETKQARENETKRIN